MKFETSGSTFSYLAIQADSGVTFNAPLSVIESGLLINSDFDESTDGDGAIATSYFADGVQLSVQGDLRLQSATGSMERAGALTFHGGSGVVLEASLESPNAGSILTLHVDDGEITVASANSIAANGPVQVTAWDLDLAGSLSTGADTGGVFSVHGSKVAQTVQLGQGSSDRRGDNPSGLHLSLAEVQRLTASGGLFIGGSPETSGSITVTDTFTDDAGQYITSLSTLIAQHDDMYVAFEDASTFHGLAVQADNRVLVGADLTTTSASMHLDGDLDQEAGGSTQSLPSAFAGVSDTDIVWLGGSNIPGRTITAQGQLILEAHTGGLRRESSLNLLAKDGVLLSQDLGLGLSGSGRRGGELAAEEALAHAIAGAVSHAHRRKEPEVQATEHEEAADSHDGSSGRRAGGEPLQINADTDSDAQGVLTLADSRTIDTGDNHMIVTASDVDLQGSIVADSGTTFFHGSTAGQQLSMGGSEASTGMHLSAAELQRITTAQMVVGGASHESGHPDYNSQIRVDTLSTDVTEHLNTVVLVAKDDSAIEFVGASTFQTLHAQAESGISIGDMLTTVAGEMTIDCDLNSANEAAGMNNFIHEVAGLTTRAATVLTLGSSTSTGILEPMGSLTLAAGAGIVVNNDITARQVGREQVFHADEVDVGDGALTIAASRTVSTNDGLLLVTASDLDLSGSFTAGVSSMQLHASQVGQAFALGDVASTAGTVWVEDAELARITATAGITVGSSLSGSFAVSSVSADSSDSFGMMSLIAVRDGSRVDFMDVDSVFSGGLQVQAAAGIAIEANLTTQLLPVVLDTGAAALSIAQWQLFSTSGQALQLTTNDIDMVGSRGIDASGATIRILTKDEDRAIGLGETPQAFHLSDSELGSITATGGLTIGSSLTGSISVDGVTESSCDEVGGLTLIATREERYVQFVSAASVFNKGITIQAAAGLDLEVGMTVKASATTLEVGPSEVSIRSGAFLHAEDQDIAITLDDLRLHESATVQVGNGTISLRCATTAQPVGIGNGLASYPPVSQFHISDDELQQISARGLVVGGETCGSFTVDAIDAADSAGISGIVTLATVVDDSSVHFASVGSTFNTLHAQADDGILVEGDITTLVGDLQLDGDFEHSSAADAANDITLSGVRILEAKSLLLLEAASGRVEADGELTLRAGQGITFQDSLAATHSGTAMVLLADQDGDGDGTLTIAQVQSVDNYDSEVQVTAWDLDLDGRLGAGTSTVAIHGSQAAQTLGLGEAIGSLHLSVAELSRIEVAPLPLHPCPLLFVLHLECCPCSHPSHPAVAWRPHHRQLHLGQHRGRRHLRGRVRHIRHPAPHRRGGLQPGLLRGGELLLQQGHRRRGSGRHRAQEGGRDPRRALALLHGVGHAHPREWVGIEQQRGGPDHHGKRPGPPVGWQRGVLY